MYLRVFIIILLTAVFLKYFGLKSFNKLKSGGVLIDRKHKYSTTIEAPIIVVCPRNPQTKTGWKENMDICRDVKTAEDMIECIDLHTYSLGDAIIVTYSNGGHSLINDSAWKEIVEYIPLGKCYKHILDAGSVGFSHETSLTIVKTQIQPKLN